MKYPIIFIAGKNMQCMGDFWATTGLIGVPFFVRDAIVYNDKY